MTPGATQFGAFTVVAVAVIVLTVVQVRSDQTVFRRYFRGINPLIVVPGVAVLGYLSLAYLRPRGFEIFDPGPAWNGVVFSLKVVPFLAGAAILADLVLRFPEDINVGAPDALSFYPVIGFTVEVCLHAVPLAMLMAILGRTGTTVDARFWTLAIAIALVEAVFQAAVADSTGTAVFSGVHLLVIGVLQIYVFQRYGFVSMYAFRLAYYALWHVAWGAARLRLLF